MRTTFLSKFKLLLGVLLPLWILVACTTENDDMDYEESMKDISGTWEVVQAFRNEEDITQVMDFSNFKLTFKEDNSYSLENRLPFIVTEDGTWSLDDPQYPMYLNLQAQGGEAAVQTALNMSVEQGKRQLGLSFSPGCERNTYTYLFQRED